MPPDLSRKIEGRKFMWDGRTYESDTQASEVLEGYRKEGFEAEMIVEDNQFLVYTRRPLASQSGG